MRERHVSRLCENKANFQAPIPGWAGLGCGGRQSHYLLQGFSRGVVSGSWDVYAVRGWLLCMDERGVTMRYRLISLLVALAVSAVADAEVAMQPFGMDWRDNSAPLADLSSFLDAPAGKSGHVGIKDGHLVTPERRRLRIWGVNFTGAACFPSREDAPVVAAHLARFGINCVRFHFLDANGSASLFVRGRDDTRALDPKHLDTLDYFVAELKKRGIYSNLNLNVGRTYRKGDGVRDYEYLGMAKVVNYFDEQVQMLHKEYARQLLTHRNPYTGA
jgi:hypothetical protein